MPDETQAFVDLDTSRSLRRFADHPVKMDLHDAND